MKQKGRAGHQALVWGAISRGGQQDEHTHEGKSDVMIRALSMYTDTADTGTDRDIEQAPVLLLLHLLLALAHLSLLLLLRNPRQNTTQNRVRRASCDEL